MVHGIRASSYVTLLFFMKLYYLTHRADSKLQHNSSSLQLTANVCDSRHSHLSRPFDHRHPDISLLIITLREYQNIINIKLRSVYLPATVTNKRNCVAKGLVEDLI